VAGHHHKAVVSYPLSETVPSHQATATVYTTVGRNPLVGS
jgi:hypothetical protein